MGIMGPPLAHFGHSRALEQASSFWQCIGLAPIVISKRPNGWDQLMKSQSIVEYGKALQETVRDTPAPTGRQVLLKITHCGVCHSDVHLHDGYFDMGGGKQMDIRAGRELPFTLGHEIQGEVVALGSEADVVSVGDPVVAYPWIGCGECAGCRDGQGRGGHEGLGEFHFILPKLTRCW